MSTTTKTPSRQNDNNAACCWRLLAGWNCSTAYIYISIYCCCCCFIALFRAFINFLANLVVVIYNVDTVLVLFLWQLSSWQNNVCVCLHFFRFISKLQQVVTCSLSQVSSTCNRKARFFYIYIYILFFWYFGINNNYV